MIPKAAWTAITRLAHHLRRNPAPDTVAPTLAATATSSGGTLARSCFFIDSRDRDLSHPLAKPDPPCCQISQPSRRYSAARVACISNDLREELSPNVIQPRHSSQRQRKRHGCQRILNDAACGKSSSLFSTSKSPCHHHQSSTPSTPRTMNASARP